MNMVTTELTAGSKEMEDENFMVLVKLAQAEPNQKLEAVMEGLKFLLLRVRRQYGWGLEEDVERQMERIGVFTALQLWHGSDRRQFAALAAWQVRRELWNEVRRERDFKKHRAYESLDEHGELAQEQEVVNDFYQLDERQTQLLAVRVLLPRLPEVQAVVMRALYIEGKEPQQVAREQRINVSSVYRRRDRGIANLHKLLVTAREVA